MLIRAVFKQGGEATATEMSKHIPNVDLTESLNLQYGKKGSFQPWMFSRAQIQPLSYRQCFGYTEVPGFQGVSTM